VKSSGLPLTNKIYINVPLKEDKASFLTFASSNVKNMTGFKEIKEGDLDGLVLTFTHSRDVVAALNVCTDYPAFPVVLFDGVECTHINEIIVAVQPSVNKDDFLRRLTKVTSGAIGLQEIKPKLFIIDVQGLRNPSNALILANLIAKDNVWVRHARVNWIPLNGYVTTTMSVETLASSSLGQKRELKIVINIFDPDIKIKTDLLPQMGQGLTPLPFAGENWLDVFPVEIKEINLERSKKVIITYPFRYLQFGVIAFNSLTISYEKNGKLKTTSTPSCRYFANGLIGFNQITDLQDLPTDKLDLPSVDLVEVPPSPNYISQYKKLRIGSNVLCFGLGALFMVGALVSFKRKLSNWFTKDDCSQAWSVLRYSIHEQEMSKASYVSISKKLNNVMVETFGVSLYTIDMKFCNSNFRNLVKELNKVYEDESVLDTAALRVFLKTFCKERNYL
jgi:hypothetical protein